MPSNAEPASLEPPEGNFFACCIIREAVAWPFEPSALDPVILEGGLAGRGERLARVFQGADRDLRVELVAAHLLGVAIVRHLLQLEPLASASVDGVATRPGPALDRDLGTG